MCYNEKLKKDEKCDCIEFKCTHLTTFVSAPGEELELKKGEDATVPDKVGGTMLSLGLTMMMAWMMMWIKL